jgi:hypothetical protein
MSAAAKKPEPAADATAGSRLPPGRIGTEPRGIGIGWHLALRVRTNANCTMAAAANAEHVVYGRRQNPWNTRNMKWTPDFITRSPLFEGGGQAWTGGQVYHMCF